MLTAVVAALLALVVLAILAVFLLGAWREHRRYLRTLSNKTVLSAHPLDRHVTAIIHIQDGQIVHVEEPQPAPFFSLPPSWYARRRMVVSLGLLLMLALALVAQDGLAGGGADSAIQQITSGLGLSFLSSAHTIVQPTPVAQHAAVVDTSTASQRLVRVDSASPAQYHTAYQLQVWSYASCSGIAMEMVMNAYGRHLIAADVLEKEYALGVWNSDLGLLRDEGIALTAATFGFDADAGRTRGVQDVITIANQGQPVIVSVRDSYYFPGGHLFVIRGGDDQYVYIADSSPHNFQRMTRAMFVGMWQTFSAVLTPRP